VIDIRVEHGRSYHGARRHFVWIIRAERDLYAVKMRLAHAFFCLRHSPHSVLDYISVGRVSESFGDANARVVREKQLKPLVLGIESAQPYAHCFPSTYLYRPRSWRKLAGGFEATSLPG